MLRPISTLPPIHPDEASLIADNILGEDIPLDFDGMVLSTPSINVSVDPYSFLQPFVSKRKKSSFRTIQKAEYNRGFD